VSRIGKTGGLELRLFRPLPEVKREFYAEVPIGLEALGSYHEVATFLNRMGLLDRIVDVRDIAMHTPAEMDGEQVLTLECTLVTYRLLTEAEEPSVDLEPKPYRRTAGSSGATEPFRYDPIGRRDPFRSPFQPDPTDDAPESDPLQRYEIDQYTLIATAEDGEAALLQDPTGGIHRAVLGSVIGRNEGTVSEIRSADIEALAGGAIVVVEEYRAIEGELIINEITMRVGCASSR
jgi:hypothetical protein